MRPRQRGYLLIALLLTLVSLSAVYLTSALKKQGMRTDWRAKRETLRALHDAKVALIAFGSIEDNTPGTLPNPSSKVDGQYDSSNYPTAQYIPWAFLGLKNRMDGNGDCLWYARSGKYSNVTRTETRLNDDALINPASPGTLTLNSAAIPQAAVVISSGPALANQARIAAGSATCASGTVDQFLEGANAGTTGTFVNDSTSETFNDTVLGITHSELLKPILKRVLHALGASDMRKEITKRINAQPVGVTTGTLAALRGTDSTSYQSFDGILIQPSTSSLVYSNACPGLPVGSPDPYKHPVSWLCFNDWYSHIVFQRSAPSLSVSLAPPSTYHCTMALDTGQTSCAN